jgi:hypothetical protein
MQLLFDFNIHERKASRLKKPLTYLLRDVKFLCSNIASYYESTEVSQCSEASRGLLILKGMMDILADISNEDKYTNNNTTYYLAYNFDSSASSPKRWAIILGGIDRSFKAIKMGYSDLLCSDEELADLCDDMDGYIKNMKYMVQEHLIFFSE